MQPQPAFSVSCPNCGSELLGKYCYSCGQKKIENKERTLKYFFTEFMHASFHIEHNILGSFWKLLIRPGFIVREFIEGRRKRYMSPFAVFAVINILFFVFNPLRDLNLQLHDHPHQYYGSIAQRMIDERLTTRNVSFEEYAKVYDKMATSLSKILVITNVPFLALFIMLMYLKKKTVFFSDHLIFALNFFAFLLLFSLVMTVIVKITLWMGISVQSPVFQLSFVFGFVIYLFLAVKKVYQENWLWTFLKSNFILLGFLVTHMAYRFVLFLLTFSVT